MNGFTPYEATYEGKTKTVFRAGSGPAVIVMHEVPNLHPGVIAFGRRVVDAGFTVFMPSLFGTPGAPATVVTNVRGMARACVATEFAVWATRTTSPVTTWLRALARDAHRACGGPGVGAVGMCLTGGFALAMMVDDVVVAPVLSQPSVPFPITAAHRRDLGISDDDLEIVRRRAAAGACVLGLRFTGDILVPDARFARLREELGDRFTAVEIDSKRGNPHGVPRAAHSVLSHHFVDAPGHPTRDALDHVLAFLSDRLSN
ncbi:MAG: dienelactone hydrolase family protein [Myxococcota bacterium]|nr:dienelactone hydrolase family protein [Deltaproteobacteria bacterium]MDQ3335420.1 dienelactone hydrolase family protein [Myxococcota bacterium]